MRGLVLVESLKPMYFANNGGRQHFKFVGDSTWPITRHERNQEDEDIPREDCKQSLLDLGFCQAARADAVLKRPADITAYNAGHRASLSAATLIKSLQSCWKEHR